MNPVEREFAEDPPLRRLPPLVRLTREETFTAWFARLQAANQVPAAAVLTTYVGTACGTAGHSGHRLDAAGAALPPGGQLGRPIPSGAAWDAWRKLATVERPGGERAGVWAPPEGTP